MDNFAGWPLTSEPLIIHTFLRDEETTETRWGPY